MRDLLKRFTARFDSECGACGAPISEGDLIARTPDGEYICEDCFEDYT
jgi:formylmethanofuran dehydrogenase subunit E